MDNFKQFFTKIFLTFEGSKTTRVLILLLQYNSKNSDNSQEHVVYECAKTKKLRAKLTKELNDLDNATKNKTLLDSIFYWYYSKDLKAKKSDNKGIRLIK